jgi:cation-transporting ATPase E
LNDIVIFRAGNQIPADAKIITGDVAVNEALLTGEADEIKKTTGGKLMSGSFIVSGECRAQLTAVGADSYISQLTIQAKKSKNKEQSEIIRSLNRIVLIAGIAIIPIGILLFSEQYLMGNASAKLSVQSMAAAVIGMIPEGLFLLASVTLALSAMRLAKNKVLLHDMKSIETLARVDVLCVDKTGTITDDKMEVKDVVWFAEDETKKQMLVALLGEVVSKLPADNATMAALKAKYSALETPLRTAA